MLHFQQNRWSRGRDLNPRPADYEMNASLLSPLLSSRSLPLSPPFAGFVCNDLCNAFLAAPLAAQEKPEAPKPKPQFNRKVYVAGISLLAAAKTGYNQAPGLESRGLIENRDALLQMTARTVDVRPLEKLPGHVEIRGSSGSDSYVIFPKSF